MKFLKNLSIRTKIFSGTFLSGLVFLALIASQFNRLGNIKDDVVSLHDIQKASNTVQNLAILNSKNVGLFLELISNKNDVSTKHIFEEYNKAFKETQVLYDSLFVYLQLIYPANQNIDKVIVLNDVNGNNSKLTGSLKSYFDNAYKIKNIQLEEGDNFSYVKKAESKTILKEDSMAVPEAIIPIKAPDVQGNTRTVQLFKLYGYYKKNSLIVDEQYREILKYLSKEFDKNKTQVLVTNQSIINSDGIFFLVSIVVITLVLLLIGKTISQPLKHLENVALKLSKGELPKRSEIVNTHDEIGNMARAFNILTEGLKKTSEFAIEIGRSNFTSKFEPLSSKDVLGNALLEMRKSLQAANKEENKRKVEDKERNWTTEGLARFGDILRKHTENVSLLSRDIIQNLVKYLNANQGGIFILNDSDKKNVYLELMSAYAYSREKFLKKHIKLGEGLVGGVAIEKYTVYMTDLPEEYIDIESGLGSANPKSLLIVPLKLEEQVLGVIEIASFNELKKFEIQLVERIAESIASTLSTTKINTTTAELLEKSRVKEQEMKEYDTELRRSIGKMRVDQRESQKREAELKEEIKELESIRVSTFEQTKQQAKKIDKLDKANEKIKQNIDRLFVMIIKGIDVSLEPMILVDQYTKIRLFNKAAENVTGFNRAELTGRSLNAILDPEWAEEISNKISLFFQTNKKVLIDKEFKGSLQSKLGENIPILMHMQNIVIKEQNNIVLFIKNLGIIKKFQKERDKIKERLMLKEFDYTIKINNLDYFIKEQGLVVPPDIEARTDLIRWNDSYSIGLKIIDTQHKRWIEFINILYREYKLKAKKEDILEHMAKLLDYADYHFGFEEKYMEDFKCDALCGHKDVHADFVGRIIKLRDRYVNGEEDAVYKLIVLLNNWTLSHIQNDDKKYVPCFSKNGLT